MCATRAEGGRLDDLSAAEPGPTAVARPAPTFTNQIPADRRYWVLATVMLVQFTAVMTSTIVSTATPTIVDELHGLNVKPVEWTTKFAFEGPTARQRAILDHRADVGFGVPGLLHEQGVDATGSIAFIAGVTPLALAHGAGAGSQNAIGTGVVGGMITATVLAIFFVPVFFQLINTRLQHHK